MGAPDLLEHLQRMGLRLSAKGSTLQVSPRAAITDEARYLIRQHKDELLAALAVPETFCFSPPGDPANDNEALQERVAIMVESGMGEAEAHQEARWKADKERSWRAHLRSAARVLEAPKAHQEALLSRYRDEATRRYGERTGIDMAGSLRSWIKARRVN